MASLVRLGVVGTGWMAAAMARTAARLPGAKIAAVVSADPQRARQFAQVFTIPHVCETHAELVQRSDIDAIYVANRTSCHVSAASAALSAGKPVLVEKPVAAVWQEGERLVAEARARGVLLVENLWCLALPSYREFAARLHGGDYGTPVHFTFDFGYPVDRSSHPFLFELSDGGVLRDRAIYGLSLALRLLGPVRRMTSDIQFDAEGVDVAAAMQLTHAGGASSQLAFALNSLMSNTATLACTKGVLRLKAPAVGSEAISFQQTTPASQPRPLTGGTKARLVESVKAHPIARRLNRRRTAPRTLALSYGSGPYEAVLQHFCDLVRAGRAESDLIPLSLTLEALRLVDAARCAHPGSSAGAVE